MDSNHRPPAPKAGALTRLRYAPLSLLLDSKPDSSLHTVQKNLLTPIYRSNCSKTVPKPLGVILPVPKPPSHRHGGSIFEEPLASSAISSASISCLIEFRNPDRFLLMSQLTLSGNNIFETPLLRPPLFTGGPLRQRWSALEKPFFDCRNPNLI